MNSVADAISFPSFPSFPADSPAPEFTAFGHHGNR